MKQIISSKFESAVQLVESNGRSKANRKLVKKISRRDDLNIRQTKAIPIVPSKVFITVTNFTVICWDFFSHTLHKPGFWGKWKEK